MLLRNLGEVYKKGLFSMSDLYNRIEVLCAAEKITITTMCKESGASRASLTDLKKGRKQKLSADTLDKIANYFDTTVDYLLGRTDDPENSDRFGLEDPAERDFVLDVTQRDTPSQPDVLDEVDIAFYGEYKELSEDDKDTIRDMVRVMRERRAKKQE